MLSVKSTTKISIFQWNKFQGDFFGTRLLLSLLLNDSLVQIWFVNSQFVNNNIKCTFSNNGLDFVKCNCHSTRNVF